MAAAVAVAAAAAAVAAAVADNRPALLSRRSLTAYRNLERVDQALDEVGQGFAGLAYWLEILAIYAMNIFQKGNGGGSGGGGTPDPVTCTQLTELVQRILNHLTGTEYYHCRFAWPATATATGGFDGDRYGPEGHRDGDQQSERAMQLRKLKRIADVTGERRC